MSNLRRPIARPHVLMVISTYALLFVFVVLLAFGSRTIYNKLNPSVERQRAELLLNIIDGEVRLATCQNRYECEVIERGINYGKRRLKELE